MPEDNGKAVNRPEYFLEVHGTAQYDLLPEANYLKIKKSQKYNKNVTGSHKDQIFTICGENIFKWLKTAQLQIFRWEIKKSKKKIHKKVSGLQFITVGEEKGWTLQIKGEVLFQKKIPCSYPLSFISNKKNSVYTPISSI